MLSDRRSSHSQGCGFPRLKIFMAGYPDGFIEDYWAWNNGEISLKEFRKDIGLPSDEFERYLRTYDAEQLFKREMEADLKSREDDISL